MLFAIVAVAALSACASGGAAVSQKPPGEAGSIYVCRNGGKISALYGSQGKAARITVNGVTVQMDPVQAPFGTRFRADDGSTFWVNGQDVLLEWENGEMLFCREQGR